MRRRRWYYSQINTTSHTRAKRGGRKETQNKRASQLHKKTRRLANEREKGGKRKGTPPFHYVGVYTCKNARQHLRGVLSVRVSLSPVETALLSSYVLLLVFARVCMCAGCVHFTIKSVKKKNTSFPPRIAFSWDLHCSLIGCSVPLRTRSLCPRRTRSKRRKGENLPKQAHSYQFLRRAWQINVQENRGD